MLDLAETEATAYQVVNDTAYVSEWAQLSLLYGTTGQSWHHFDSNGVEQNISTGLAYRFQRHGQFLEIKGKINARQNNDSEGIVTILPTAIAEMIDHTVFIPIYFGGTDSEGYYTKTLMVKIYKRSGYIRIQGIDAVPDLLGFFYGIVRLKSGYPGIEY